MNLRNVALFAALLLSGWEPLAAVFVLFIILTLFDDSDEK